MIKDRLVTCEKAIPVIADVHHLRSEGRLSTLRVDRHEGPIAAFRHQVSMLRCGPSKETFSATAKFSDKRIHRLRTKQNFSALHRMSAFGRISCLLAVMMLKINSILASSC
jgi:hypothetical protein